MCSHMSVYTHAEAREQLQALFLRNIPHAFFKKDFIFSLGVLHVYECGIPQRCYNLLELQAIVAA